jgi:hypothetical protein
MRALLTVTCYIVIWSMDKKFGGFAARVIDYGVGYFWIL